MAAELQAITFREYLPALLGGTDHIPPYQRYNESVNVGMSNIMATAAFRFVIHTSYAAITIEYLTNHLYFLGIDKPLSQSLHQELIQMIGCRHSMVFHERAFDYYFIPPHAVSNTINATYGRRTMGRLDIIPWNIQRLSSILIGCILYGMVKM